MCDKTECEDEHTGESSSTFGERCKECLNTPWPLLEQQYTTGHITPGDNFKITGREEDNMARSIKEAIYKSEQPPTKNKNYLQIKPATNLG